MNKAHLLETFILILASAFLYWAGFEVQNLIFSFTEHIPGVNWFYLPSGLRVLLVLVAGVYGAIGIFFATMLINLIHTPDIRDGMLISTALASGFGAWVALSVLRWRGVIAAGLTGLTSVALLQFAFLYAILNTMFHQAVWLISQRNGSFFMVDVWPMFVGDLLGAAAFLYGMKRLLLLKKSHNRSINDDLLN